MPIYQPLYLLHIVDPSSFRGTIHFFMISIKTVPELIMADLQVVFQLSLESFLFCGLVCAESCFCVSVIISLDGAFMGAHEISLLLEHGLVNIVFYASSTVPYILGEVLIA